eukprot:1178418-Amphidinium_carterae.2
MLCHAVSAGKNEHHPKELTRKNNPSQQKERREAKQQQTLRSRHCTTLPPAKPNRILNNLRFLHVSLAGSGTVLTAALRKRFPDFDELPILRGRQTAEEKYTLCLVT